MCLSCAARFARIAELCLAAAASKPCPLAAFAISASNTVAAGRYALIFAAISASPAAWSCPSSLSDAHSIGLGPHRSASSAPRATDSFPADPRVRW